MNSTRNFLDIDLFLNIQFYKTITIYAMRQCIIYSKPRKKQKVHNFSLKKEICVIVWEMVGVFLF